MSYQHGPPPWRNGLACWTSNSKVVGSSPTGGGLFSFCRFPRNLLNLLNLFSFSKNCLFRDDTEFLS